MKRFAVTAALLLCAAGFAFGADFGLLIEQKFEAENESVTYTPGFAPWFSLNNGRGLSVYLSGLVSFPYNNYRNNPDESGFQFVPELTRFALKYRFSNLSVEAGRTGYSDVLGFAASGLFDGLCFEMFLPFGKISAGAFYSGLQYKETAKIVMTGEDALNFSSPWGFENFNDYFASRRLLAYARTDIPVGSTFGFSAEVLAQFDLSDAEEKLHSQYFMLLVDYYPMSIMRISAGLIFESLQSDRETGFALGALARMRVDIPTALNDQFGVTVKFTSGGDDGISIFTPVSSHPQGTVFSLPLSGLASATVNYDVRLSPSIFAQCSMSYFMRTYNAAGEGGLYGGEISANFAWQPFDDLRAVIGGGVFFPGLGNFYPSGTGVMWKVNAGLVLAL